MPKFYRYLIYRMLSFWNNGDKLETPVANVIIVLSIVHFVQLMTVYSFLLKFFHGLDFVFAQSKAVVMGFLFLFGVLNYFVLYNKKRWEGYTLEFKDETIKHKQEGTILILTYIFGSFVFFFAAIPLLFR